MEKVSHSSEMGVVLFLEGSYQFIAAAENQSEFIDIVAFDRKTDVIFRTMLGARRNHKVSTRLEAVVDIRQVPDSVSGVLVRLSIDRGDAHVRASEEFLND